MAAQAQIKSLLNKIEALKEREKARWEALTVEDIAALEIDDSLRKTALGTIKKLWPGYVPPGELVETVAKVYGLRSQLLQSREALSDAEFAQAKRRATQLAVDFLRPVCELARAQAAQELEEQKNAFVREIIGEIEKIKASEGERWPLWQALERRAPGPIATPQEAAVRIEQLGVGDPRKIQDLLPLLLGERRSQELLAGLRERETAASVRLSPGAIAAAALNS